MSWLVTCRLVGTSGASVVSTVSVSVSLKLDESNTRETKKGDFCLHKKDDVITRADVD